MTSKRIIVTDPALLASVQLAASRDERLQDLVIVDELIGEDVVEMAKSWEGSIEVYEPLDVQEPYWIQLNNKSASKPWKRSR